jgi:hypothetical protein
MLSPEDWGKRMPFQAFIATVKLLGDRTWEVVRASETLGNK